MATETHMPKTKKQERDEAILNHAFKLQRIFPKTKSMRPVTLYCALLALEEKAHRSAERECSDKRYTREMIERVEASIVKALDELLGYKEEQIPVFLNGDPRGYALKVEDDYVRKHKLDIHTDWGGYGVLAPNFKE